MRFCVSNLIGVPRKPSKLRQSLNSYSNSIHGGFKQFEILLELSKTEWMVFLGVNLNGRKKSTAFNTIWNLIELSNLRRPHNLDVEYTNSTASRIGQVLKSHLTAVWVSTRLMAFPYLSLCFHSSAIAGAVWRRRRAAQRRTSQVLNLFI